MDEDKTSHKLELRIQKLESRILYGGAAITAIAAVFGITGIVTLSDVRETLDEAVDAVFESEASQAISAMQSEVEAKRDEISTHYEAIKSVRSELCADPGSVEKYGFCIFHASPPGVNYVLNYGAAASLCAANGARLCSGAEVKAAHGKGYSKCAIGWVSDLGAKSRPGGDPTYNQTGTLAMSMQTGSDGCKGGFSTWPGQNIVTQTANAHCCM